jgi:5'-3' exoribonuclease 2
MNGIVHPCTHPEGRDAPETEEEMMVEIFKYTERVVNMARPRKVLMMAIGKLGFPFTFSNEKLI